MPTVVKILISAHFPSQIYLLTDLTTAQRQKKLRKWFDGGGIMFAGYEMFRNLAQGKKLKPARRMAFKQYLLDPGECEASTSTVLCPRILWLLGLVIRASLESPSNDGGWY